MYEPIYNSVLVMIDDKDAEWGTGNDDSMLGKSYSKGTVIRIGDLMATDRYRFGSELLTQLADELKQLKGRSIMWNEGVEAGTTFDFDGKLFGMIYWWDIRGVKVSIDEEPAYQDANKKAGNIETEEKAAV